jgi:hypothetical protein
VKFGENFMKPLNVLFKRGRSLAYPAKIGIKKDEQIYKQLLYDQSNTKNLFDIRNSLAKTQSILRQALSANTPIITNDRKVLVSILGVGDVTNNRNIYEDSFIINNDEDFDLAMAKNRSDPMDHQRLTFQAGLVYDYLSDVPVYINYTPQQPTWSMDTYSGRSKSTGFNIQGYNQSDYVSRDGCFNDKILVHFDWICADLRIASVLSKDEELESAFRHGDPYQYLLDRSDGMFENRQESKIALLKAINSLNFDSAIFTKCFTGLREWMIECAHSLTNEMPLSTILGKTFIIPENKTILSALNGVLQGSIAHAMHNVLVKTHELFPRSIVCEIHDSLVLSCEDDRMSLKHMVSKVMEIMSKPFAGYLDRDIYFPLRFGVGKKWREYKYSKIQRENDE